MKLCPCCMEEHNVRKIKTIVNNVYNGIGVTYTAEYCYCNNANEMYADEHQIDMNYNAMKNAYKALV